MASKAHLRDASLTTWAEVPKRGTSSWSPTRAAITRTEQCALPGTNAGRRTECGALTPGLWPHLSHAIQAFADHASQAAFQLASNVSWSAVARARCSPGSRSKRRLRLVREGQERGQREWARSLGTPSSS